jgi:hypothetical protein
MKRREFIRGVGIAAAGAALSVPAAADDSSIVRRREFQQKRGGSWTWIPFEKIRSGMEIRLTDDGKTWTYFKVRRGFHWDKKVRAMVFTFGP